MGNLKAEKRIVITDGMSVDYVKKHGSAAQKVAAQIFDADMSGKFSGNEVELFNNCVLTLGKNQLVIHDKQLQANGKKGKIILNNYNLFSPALDYTVYKKDASGTRTISGFGINETNMTGFDVIESTCSEKDEEIHWNVERKGIEHKEKTFVEKIKDFFNSLDLRPANEQRIDEWMNSDSYRVQ